MRLFIPEPTIDVGKDGFDSIDMLGRKDHGKRLSDLLSAVEDPVVIAIDGGWGSGKTVFLKLWVGEHIKRPGNKDQVIYFDAFLNDYLDDPLIALVSEIVANADKKRPAILDRLKRAAVPISRIATRVALAAATSGISEVTNAAGDAAAKAAENELAKSAEAFWRKEDGRRAAMIEFRETLTEMARSLEGGKLIIVVDELDRCRPDYALALLETIKHFFAVDNVHFVLGVNLEELQNTVRARYGMGTEAHNYLHKFIHLQMRLPTHAGPRPEDTAAVVHFDNIAEKMKIPENTRRDIMSYFAFQAAQPSLREVERMASLAALSAPSIENLPDGNRSVLCGALVLKVLNPPVYSRLLRNRASYRDTVDTLCPKSGTNQNSGDNHTLRYFRAAWAGFLDCETWKRPANTFSSNLQEMFGLGMGLPCERGFDLGKFILRHLETFQLPNPAQ